MDYILKEYRKIKDIVKLTYETYVNVICPLVQITPKIGPKMSVDYSITITLKPSLYNKPYETQFDETAVNITNLFGTCKLTLIAELTKTYNIHYHGLISVPLSHGRDPRKYIFDQLRKYSKVGKSQVDQATDYNGWHAYISKDIKNNIQNAIIYPIVKDDYEMFTNVTYL